MPLKNSSIGVDLHFNLGLGAFEPIFGTSKGLPHFLLQWLYRKKARTEEFWARATIHRPLERFQAIDLSFRLAVAPGLSDRISNRVDISLRRAREPLHRVQARLLCVLQPGAKFADVFAF